MKTNPIKEKNQILIAISTLNEHCTNIFVFVESREKQKESYLLLRLVHFFYTRFSRYNGVILFYSFFNQIINMDNWLRELRVYLSAKWMIGLTVFLFLAVASCCLDFKARICREYVFDN